MKKLLTIAAGLSLTAAVQAQTLTAYRAVINSQSPFYYNTLDNTLAPSAGTGTFNATAGAVFAADCFGNSNGAVACQAATDFLSLTSPNMISGAGSPTGVGSLSLLFYVPNSIPATGYYFSDGETTGSAANGQTAKSAFALQFSGGALTLKIGNKSYPVPAGVTVSGNTWYYLALTYDLNGTTADVKGIHYYLGAVGGTISSAFLQKGGSGNLSAVATMGDGLTFVLGNKQAAVVGTTSTAGVTGGVIDELATWTTALSSNQITSQFKALPVSIRPQRTPGIQGSATNVMVFRPPNTNPESVPELTPDTSSPVWSSAGSPATPGNFPTETNGDLLDARLNHPKR